MAPTHDRTALRRRRHARVRAKVHGTAELPRLAVHRSNRHISAQVIDDTHGAHAGAGLFAGARAATVMGQSGAVT